MHSQKNKHLVCFIITLLCATRGATAQPTQEQTIILGMQLLEAAKAGEVTRVQSLIDAGVPVNYQNNGALIRAVGYNHSALVSTLLPILHHNRTADEWIRLLGEQLSRAAALGCLDSLKALLSAGAAIDFRSEIGTTPLYRALERKQVATAQALIAAGASLESKITLLRETPLLTAIKYNCITIVAQLLHSGARSDVQNAFGWNVLMHAAETGSIDMVKLLLVWGATPLTKHQMQQLKPEARQLLANNMYIKQK